jgi:hypothetical protein
MRAGSRREGQKMADKKKTGPVGKLIKVFVGLNVRLDSSVYP